MEWIAIFAPLIQKCIENVTPEQARARVRNPGPRAILQMLQELRGRGLSWREARQELNGTLEALKKAPDEVIDDIIAGAMEIEEAA